MTKATTHHPFIYGRPVRPGEFLNREADLRTVFNRLRNCDSTAIVGEPRIGKSSLLLKLADETTQQSYLVDDAKHMVTQRLDLHSIDNSYTPMDFWGEALRPLQEQPGHKAVTRQLLSVIQTGYARQSLEQLFNYLSERSRKLVLLLDEFERLLSHPQFQDPAFFAGLRYLAGTGGLVLVIASRLSSAEMNKRGGELLPSNPHTGSPFFNHLIDVHLRPFDETTVGELLDWVGESFSSDDRLFIRRVAGRHPFLLQAMAAALFETSGNDRHARAAERFYEQIASHFDDLWCAFDDRTRTTAVILSLVELGGQALGQNFSYGEIERVGKFDLELRQLSKLGLAERIEVGYPFDWQHLLLWQGARWTIGTQAFAWWVRDVVIAQARRLPAYDDWLKNKRYICGVLTQEEWDWLLGKVRNAPEWTARGVATLARAFLEELLKGKYGRPTT